MESESLSLLESKTDEEDTQRINLSKGKDAGVSAYALATTLLGYALGLGNAVKFPYLVGKHGGFSFVIIYTCSVLLVGFPLFYLECRWGQLTRKSTVHCYRTIHPRWEGVGWASSLVLYITSVYYSILVGYSLIYLIGSLRAPLAWAEDRWNVEMLPLNFTASDYYWHRIVLNDYRDPSNADGFGPVQPYLLLAVATVWAVVFLRIRKGMRPFDAVNYLFVAAPIVLMLVLLTRSVFLKGAADGLMFYLGRLDVDKLWSLDAWTDAVFQVLFSLSPGTGATITLASYAKRQTPIFKVAVVVAVTDTVFSLACGIFVFSLLGDMAHEGDDSVEKLASSSGSELAYRVMARGVADLGVLSNLFSVLLFMSLFFLGITTLFVWAQTLTTHLSDLFALPMLKLSISSVAFIVCLCSFALTVPFCTRLGYRLIDAVDYYATSFSLFITCFLECVMGFWSPYEKTMGKVVTGLLRSICPLVLAAATVRHLTTEFDTHGIVELRVWGFVWFTIGILPIPLFLAVNHRKAPEPLGLPSGESPRYKPPEQQECQEQEESELINEQQDQGPEASPYSSKTTLHTANGTANVLGADASLHSIIIESHRTLLPVLAGTPYDHPLINPPSSFKHGLL